MSGDNRKEALVEAVTAAYMRAYPRAAEVMPLQQEEADAIRAVLDAIGIDSILRLVDASRLLVGLDNTHPVGPTLFNRFTEALAALPEALKP